jgi:cyclophilin family peptidyl-prolyl cis-trans isomerase
MKLWRFVPCLIVLLGVVGSSSAGTILRFRTSVGEIDVELYDQDKPATVQNFLRYVNGGSYTNMIMHRIEQNFVVQGGAFNLVNAGTTNAILTNVVTFPPVTNEIFVGTYYSNTYGTIAMAKTSDPDSATSQFFFNLGDNSVSLDDTTNSGGFTVFGHVITGTNVLNFYQLGPQDRVIKEENLDGPLGELPVLYEANPTNPAVEDYVYVDVRPAQPFAAVKGNYNGLLVAPDTAVMPDPGQLTVTTTARPKQRFSGQLRLSSGRYSFTGAFDTNGNATVVSTNKGTQLLVELHADNSEITGNVKGPGWVANVVADRPLFDARTNSAAAFAGTYTMAIPGTNQQGMPKGNGFATIKVDTSGRVRIAGTLGDGVGFSQSATITTDGRWPFFVSLYHDRGSVAGWMTFTNGLGDEVHGRVYWRRGRAVQGPLFPGGFETEIDAFGSRYTPVPGTPVVALGVWPMQFSGGNLPLDFTDDISLSSANKLTGPTPYPMTVNLNLATGLFSGSVKRPGSSLARTVPFRGVVLQKRNSGYGNFLSTDKTGGVFFGPQ